jgi:hypothetical protein
MLKATVNYISESGKSAILAVTTQLGLINQRVSGFAPLPEGHKLTKGMEIEIPATKVTTEVRPNEADPAKPFVWLVFS